MKITNQFPVETNESYPWRTEDEKLGFHTEIATVSGFYSKIYNHIKDVFEGVRYQFHNPYELPHQKNPQFNGFIRRTLIYLVDLEITELDESLLNYKAEK